MTLYRNKPIVIEAFRFRVDPTPDWFADKVKARAVVSYEIGCEINTLEGVMQARAGDYIIKGIKGEIYPCKPDVFLATYEAVGKTK